MKPYKDEYSLKKKGQYREKKIRGLSILSLNLFHKILNAFNISSIIIILILYFLSFSSQRKWSIIYKSLLTTKANNNNLIDYISQTEEFHINELESLKTLKKTMPKDLIYLEKYFVKNENYLFKKAAFVINGINDSRYQIGY